MRYLVTTIFFTLILFSIGMPQSVSVTAPNGGEWWRTNINQTVTWTSSGFTNARIEFSPDNGTSWKTLVSSTAASAGTYLVRSPDALCNTCLIRVSDAADGSPSDVSNAVFFNVLDALVSFAGYSGNPILSPGSGGSWDENTRERGIFMLDGSTYKVWYGGWQGSYSTSTSSLVDLGYATSSDGISWTKSGSNPVQTTHWTEDPTIIKDGSTYYMYAEDEYTGDSDGAEIFRYTSSDGITWTQTGIVLALSGSGWDGTHVGTPLAWKEGSTWYMLYEGFGSTTAGQIGLATSSDGITWDRDAGNPILSNPHHGDTEDIAFDSILKIDGIYYVYGHWRNAGDTAWDSGLYTSTNLTDWTAYSGNPFSYNSPYVIAAPTRYHHYGVANATTGQGAYNMGFASNENALPFLADFNESAVDNYEWLLGTNSGNATTITSNELYLQTDEAQSGWVITRQNFTATNIMASIQITQASDEMFIGMSPTYVLSATNDIHSQSNFYKFYLYRPTHSGNYSLYLTKKVNGSTTDTDITGGLTISGVPIWMRIRTNQTNIFYDISLNSGASWSTVLNEAFNLSGYTLDNVFHFVLAVNNSGTNGVAHVDNFRIEPRRNRSN